jgi:class 3 adenylate cyclase
MSVDPTLLRVIAAWNEAGYWASAVDDRWRLVVVTAELAAGSDSSFAMGEFYHGSAQTAADLQGRTGHNAIVDKRTAFVRHGGWLLTDIPGRRDALRETVDPAMRDLVDEIEPCDDEALAHDIRTEAFGSGVGATMVAQRVRDSSGRIVGTVMVTKPAVGMNTIGKLASAGDLGHFARMRQLASAGRRPAAAIFADLEGSAPLAKRLPTATYLTLVQRLTPAADRCVIEAGGLVGRHAGDGVGAFFVAETLGSESAAARACITVGRALQEATGTIAEQHELLPEEVTVRAGPHWSATLYIGSIITPGRTEVTALGDEVNEAARIEACASGGRLLASKISSNASTPTTPPRSASIPTRSCTPSWATSTPQPARHVATRSDSRVSPRCRHLLSRARTTDPRLGEPHQI